MSKTKPKGTKSDKKLEPPKKKNGKPVTTGTQEKPDHEHLMKGQQPNL